MKRSQVALLVVVCACASDKGNDDSKNSNTYDVDTASGLLAGAFCGVAAECGITIRTFDGTETSDAPVTNAWCQSNRDMLIASTKSSYVASSTKADVDACVSELAGVDCSSVCGVVYNPAVCNKVLPDDDTMPNECSGSSGGSGGSDGSGGSGGSGAASGSGGSCAAGGGNCDDSCEYANDGECDEPDFCEQGTDCTDCGG